MKLLSYFQRHLWIFGLTAIFFFASFGLAQVKKPPVYVAKATDYKVSKLPVLKNTDSVPVLSAQGVYAYDLDSGVVLYEKNPDEPLFPASTTKIVTALVSLDSYNLNDVVNTGHFSDDWF